MITKSRVPRGRHAVAGSTPDPLGSRAEAAEQTLADGLPARAKTGRSVRGLARWAEVSKCATAGAAYAARADDNRLLAGTQFEAEFGQSPTAIARGARVEAIGRRNSYAVTIALLREHFDFEVTEVVPADLRHGYQKNRNGMIKRSAETHRLIGSILRGDPDAPNIIDGAVLPVRLGHATAYLEAGRDWRQGRPAVCPCWNSRRGRWSMAGRTTPVSLLRRSGRWGCIDFSPSGSSPILVETRRLSRRPVS